MIMVDGIIEIPKTDFTVKWYFKYYKSSIPVIVSTIFKIC